LKPSFLTDSASSVHARKRADISFGNPTCDIAQCHLTVPGRALDRDFLAWTSGKGLGPLGRRQRTRHEARESDMTITGTDARRCGPGRDLCVFRGGFIADDV
jgi:hypothetical protein